MLGCDPQQVVNAISVVLKRGFGKVGKQPGLTLVLKVRKRFYRIVTVWPCVTRKMNGLKGAEEAGLSVYAPACSACFPLF
jgi:hypothetical protein